MTDKKKIKELKMALQLVIDWIDAVPDETAATLFAIPGFDRDWVESILE